MKTLRQTLILLIALVGCGNSMATTYTLVASGNWTNPAVWSPAGVPGSGDDVVFADNGSALGLTLTGNVSIRSLTYDGDYRRDTLNGSGIITLSENSSWVGGLIGGSVEIVVPAGKSFNFDADTDTSNRRCLRQNAKITNNGAITWSGLGVFFYDNSLIDNNGSFTDNTNENRLYREDGATTLHFINDGTFTCNSSVSITFNINFENNGTINLNNGYMIARVKLTNNGTINLNADAATNNQFFNYQSTSGTLHFGTNTTLELFSYDLGSTLGTVTGSTGTIVFSIFSGNTAVTTINSSIPPGIHLDFGAQGNIALNANLTLNNSTSFAKDMNGSGKITIANGNTMTWIRGSLSGSVEIIVAAGGSLTIQGDTGQNPLNMSDNALITNNGDMNYNSGSLVFNTAQNMLENNGTFNFNGNHTIYNNVAGVSIFQNNGTLRKQSGLGTASLQCRLNNSASGTVSLESGSMSFVNLATNAGMLRGNGTMTFNASNQSLGGIISPGLSIGSLTLGGSVTITGNIQIEVDGSSRDVLSFSNNLVLSNASLTVVEAGSPLATGTLFPIINITGTRSGAFTSNSFPSGSYSLNYGTSSIGLLNGSLPVELVSFHGKEQVQGNLLSWKTAQEFNTARFVLERSHDGIHWENIGMVDAAGFSVEEKSYSLLDALPLPLEYYRLRSEDFDGSFNLSSVVSVARAGAIAGALHTFPNPADRELNMELTAPAEQRAMLRIVSLSGQVLQAVELQLKEGLNSLVIPISQLPGGSYYLSLETLHGRQVQCFVKR